MAGITVPSVLGEFGVETSEFPVEALEFVVREGAAEAVSATVSTPATPFPCGSGNGREILRLDRNEATRVQPRPNCQTPRNRRRTIVGKAATQSTGPLQWRSTRTTLTIPEADIRGRFGPGSSITARTPDRCGRSSYPELQHPARGVGACDLGYVGLRPWVVRGFQIWLR